MAAEDYKSDVSLTSACGQELAVLQCANKEEKEDGVHVAVQLSTVLLCLEAGVREEKVKVTTCFSKCKMQPHTTCTNRSGAGASLRCRRSDAH